MEPVLQAGRHKFEPEPGPFMESRGPLLTRRGDLACYVTGGVLTSLDPRCRRRYGRKYIYPASRCFCQCRANRPPTDRIMKLQLLLIAVFVCAASAGIPKKLFKKYAMKKVMESCFGEQLLSDMKAEVVAACEKCHGHEAPALPMMRRRLQAMFAGSELGARPAQYAQNVQYVAVPVQFQPVAAQRRWRRDAHHGKFGPAKILKLRQKISSIVGNVTCVMKELNMLTTDNQVDYDSIKARIASWELPEGLVKDISEGVEDCRQFSSCLPESIFDKTPIAAGFGKQIAFFKCMKMAKIEACMKQDFREQYLPELMRDGMDTDGEESFQTLITSALLEEDNGMM